MVNDHSIDDTRRIAEELSRKYSNIRLIDNKLDKGFANALKTGFRAAEGGVVLPVMADSCDDLGTVREMFSKINEGYDIVCASRYMKGGLRIGGSRFKGFSSSFVGRSLYYLIGLPTHDISNAFKMYRRTVLDSIDIQSKGFEVSMEIPLKAYYLGFKMTEVPTVWRERTKGKSSFRIFRLTGSYFKLYAWAIFKGLMR
mgnify:FL=1